MLVSSIIDIGDHSFDLFCRFAAIGVTLDFFLQITFFAVAMYMAGEREQKEKIDCFCCVTASNPDRKVVGKGDFAQDTPELLTIFLRDTYTPFLLSFKGKLVAMGLGVGLLVLGIWACTQVTIDFQYEWFVPDNSYYQETLAVEKRYWGGAEVPVAVYTFDGNYSSEVRGRWCPEWPQCVRRFLDMSSLRVTWRLIAEHSTPLCAWSTASAYQGARSFCR
jgi:hypothetical protein